MTCCRQCPNELGEKNRSGLCRRCVTARSNADPVTIAKRAAAIKARFANPAYREAQAERMRRYNADLPDAVRASRRKHGKANVDKLAEASRAMSKELRAENGRKRSATVLAWCPEEWRQTYRAIKTRGRSAPAAKKIVLDLIAGRPAPTKWARQRSVETWCPPRLRGEYQRLRAKIGAAAARAAIELNVTSFDRQMMRLNRGGQLVAKPDTRKSDPPMTLGGIASAAL